MKDGKENESIWADSIFKKRESMDKKKEFCRLCGKYQTEKLEKLILGEIAPGVTCSFPVCSSCLTIHHNLQLVWKEAVIEHQRREKEKALQILREKGGVQEDAFIKNSIK